MKRFGLFILINICLLLISGCEKDENTDANTVRDIDGNTYRTVTIGNQTWMAENLKVTHYPDGSEILLITDNNNWRSYYDSNVALCGYYENLIENKSKYGLLYNYEAALNACPSGWHLPSRQDWSELESSIYNDSIYYSIGKVLKTIDGWDENSGTNNYGFSAMPAGVIGLDGNCFFLGSQGRWWTSTAMSEEFIYSRYITSYNGDLFSEGFNKSAGASVRCVKD